jgi:hypothetical protein
VRTGEERGDTNGDLKPGMKFDIPENGDEWVEVMFNSEVFYNEADYLALMIIPLGLFTCIPMFIVIFCVPCICLDLCKK